MGSEFPETSPWIWCTTDIYHPNIDNTENKYDEDATNVCLNLLESGTWCSSFGLEGIVLGLQFLMHHPNLEDPLSPHFDGRIEDELFRDNVKKYMAGEVIDDGTWFDTKFKVIDGILVDTVDDNKVIEIKNNSTNEGTNSLENTEVINCTDTNEKRDNVNKTENETVEPVTDICKTPDPENETVEPDTDVSKMPVETEVSMANGTIKNEINETETDIESVAVKSDGDNDVDDDGNGNTSFYLKCVEGDIVLFSGEMDDNIDIKTNTQNLVKDTESMAVNSEQITDMCNTEMTGSNSDVVAVENVLIKPGSELRPGPGSDERNRTLKCRTTCGLWPLFRNVFVKLFQEFIAREGKNDILL